MNMLLNSILICQASSFQRPSKIRNNKSVQLQSQPLQNEQVVSSLHKIPGNFLFTRNGQYIQDAVVLLNYAGSQALIQYSLITIVIATMTAVCSFAAMPEKDALQVLSASSQVFSGRQRFLACNSCFVLGYQYLPSQYNLKVRLRVRVEFRVVTMMYSNSNCCLQV